MFRRLWPKVLLAISLLINAAFGWNYYSGNTVARVIDGDTFDLQNGNRIRLLDLDTPDFAHCGYEEAKKRLAELISGKFVTVKEWHYIPDGRRQGLVYLGSQLINETMLKEGWGKVDYKPNSQKDKLVAAYHEGKENQRGVFALDCDFDGPVDQNCVIKGNIDEDTQKNSIICPVAGITSGLPSTAIWEKIFSALKKTLKPPATKKPPAALNGRIASFRFPTRFLLVGPITFPV